MVLAGLASLPSEPARAEESPRTVGPWIDSLFPPGVARGATARWRLRGRGLETIERAPLLGEGVEVLKLASSAGLVELEVRARPDAPVGVGRIWLDGPGGMSNPVEFQVDDLTQSVESEPNDSPDRANPAHRDEAVAGVLGPEDLDHFRLMVEQGAAVALEVEARRLGTPVTPVITLFDAAGRALGQARQTPGLEGDCRLRYRFAAAGTYVVQVRDLLYGGGEHAVYRLRVDSGPFATGLFPLGGRAGESVAVTASGGNLAAPVERRVRLPERAGAEVEPGPFQAGGRSFVVPQRLAVGDGPEVMEFPAGPGKLPFGATANGRIGRPGEVDRYVVAVPPGARVRVRLDAARLGSWLDSVVAVHDPRGRRLAENDDAPALVSELVRARDPAAVPPDTDSALEVVSESAQLVVAVRDRYGRGGPEYAYRLTVGPTRPDLAAAVVLGGPGDEPRGAWNLAPGDEKEVAVAVLTEGRTGRIMVHAEGLPAGVAAEPLVLVPRGLAGARNGAAAGLRRERLTGRLILRVADDAAPALGALRIVAAAAGRGGEGPTRVASFWVELGRGSLSAPSRPVVRSLPSVPVRVVAGRR